MLRCVVWAVLFRAPNILDGINPLIMFIWRGFASYEFLVFILSCCSKAIDVALFGFVIPAGESTVMFIFAPIFALLEVTNSSKFSFFRVIVQIPNNRVIV